MTENKDADSGKATRTATRTQQHFIHVEPTFKVVQDAGQLQNTLRELHRPLERGPVELNTRQDASVNSVKNPMEPCGTFSPQQGSLVQAEGNTPRVLCLWDIDDTLVTSGEHGVRQHLMFEDQDLRRMFRSMPPSTRHLLLSQGSTDDVLMSSGRLSFLRRYFLGERGNEFPSSDDDFDYNFDDDDGESGGIFSCCASETRKEKKIGSILDQPSVAIHLSRIDGCRKEVSCSEWSNWMPTDREGNYVRWLILRPGMWGISLARLSSLVPPSRRTAFVDGKHFRKLDIAWSFACSGHWDRVIFIDNNLCEVGIIKYGMSYSAAASTLERRRADKVFLSDFSLLKASAKLYQIEKESKKRVTYVEEEGDAEVVSSPFTLGGDFSTLNSLPVTQEVELVVANLHFHILDYNRVVRGYGRSSPMILSLSRQSGHPTFFEDQCCTDEQYDEFIHAFEQAENAIDQIILEDLRIDGVVGNGWKRGWKPNSNKVVVPRCKTRIEVEAVRGLCVPLYRRFLSEVCGNMDRARHTSNRQMRVDYLSTARKEAYAIYLELWRSCPIIDPAFIFEFGQLLYVLHFSDELPSKRKVENMREKAEQYVTAHDPEGAVHDTPQIKQKE